MFCSNDTHFIVTDNKILFMRDSITGPNDEPGDHIINSLQRYERGTMVPLELPENFSYPIRFFDTKDYLTLLIDSNNDIYLLGYTRFAKTDNDYKDRFYKVYPRSSHESFYRFIQDETVEEIKIGFNCLYVLSSGKLRIFSVHDMKNYLKVGEYYTRSIDNFEIDKIYDFDSLVSIGSHADTGYLVLESGKEFYILYDNLNSRIGDPIKIDNWTNNEVASVKPFKHRLFVLDNLGYLYYCRIFFQIEEFHPLPSFTKLDIPRKISSFHVYELEKGVREETVLYNIVYTDYFGEHYNITLDYEGIKEETPMRYIKNTSTILSMSEKCIVFLSENGYIYRKEINFFENGQTTGDDVFILDPEKEDIVLPRNYPKKSL